MSPEQLQDNDAPPSLDDSFRKIDEEHQKENQRIDSDLSEVIETIKSNNNFQTQIALGALGVVLLGMGWSLETLAEHRYANLWPNICVFAITLLFFYSLLLMAYSALKVSAAFRRIIDKLIPEGELARKKAARVEKGTLELMVQSYVVAMLGLFLIVILVFFDLVGAF